jgi:hypothetical protein
VFHPQETADSELPPQQCGRCRLLFEGDPTLHPAARPDWWLCPPCRAILLRRTPHPNNVAHRRHVGETLNPMTGSFQRGAVRPSATATRVTGPSRLTA